MISGADAQDPSGDGFHLRVRRVGKEPSTVAFADAENKEREETEDRAGQEYGDGKNPYGKSHLRHAPSWLPLSGCSQIATARYCTGPK